jgi:hypothetical protein
MFPYNFRSKQLVQCAKIILLGCVLAGQPAICQSPLPTPNAPQHATDNRAATPGLPMNPDQLAPDAAVITIKGFCPGSASKGAPACSTIITRQQFSNMISAMSFNPQLANNPVAVKAFAESYVQALLIADAAENAGMDKDPQFEELMRIIRVRTLADAYRRSLQQKNSSPSAEQIENYYKQNTARFDQVELDRVTIPLGNPKLAKEAQADFRQKAQTLATEARLRLATGEEPGKVQAETYRTLGLIPPLTTDLGTKRRGNLPGALEQELFALKAGDVSKVQADPSSLTIYKIRTRSTLPLERVRAEIAQEIQQQAIQSALQAITGAIKTDFNDQYFKTHTAPPIPRAGK